MFNRIKKHLTASLARAFDAISIHQQRRIEIMNTKMDQLSEKLNQLSVAITNEHMRVNVQHAEILEAVRSGATNEEIEEMIERVEIAIDRLNTFGLPGVEEGQESLVFDIGRATDAANDASYGGGSLTVASNRFNGLAAPL
jgi:hypothetical protein